MNKNVYISLTSIYDNQEILLKTLISIKNQKTTPSKCFIYLSEEPYLLDKGFKNKIISYNNLNIFLKNNINLFEIVWVKNSGPYRKLLPLLKEKWSEDCIIITIDDDTEYGTYLITNLLNDYNKYNCVINYRGFTLKKNILNYNDRDKLNKLYLYNFFTGKGGVLYHPSFFHNTSELMFDENIYSNLCKTTDDVWFNLIRICNNVNCYIDNEKNIARDNTSKFGLYLNFNSKNNLNTLNINKTILKLKEIGYNI